MVCVWWSVVCVVECGVWWSVVCGVVWWGEGSTDCKMMATHICKYVRMYM